VALDLHRLFEREGKPVLNFLAYCVRSVQPDPVFVYLAGDYRKAPTGAKAIALHDLFCATDAPARLSVAEVLPPLNLRLSQALLPFRPARLPTAPTNGATLAGLPPLRLPPGYLFDAVVEAIESNSAVWKRIRRSYRVRRTPQQNLPDGRMNQGQRFFVEKVWQPVIRPRLVAAGFWRVRTVA
jgi:hypothetical protein